MSLLNPFNKEPSQKEAVKEEREYNKNETMLNNATYSNSQEDSVWMEGQKEKSDLIMWQQDLSPEIQILIHKIKRETPVGDVKDDVWKRPEGMTALANDTFILDMVGLVELSTSKNLINSNLSEDRILTSLKSTLFDFRCMLQENRGLYEIDKPDMHLVVRLFKNAIEPTYWRCWNNGERRHTGEFSKRLEVHTDQRMPEKSKGLFGLGG